MARRGHGPFGGRDGSRMVSLHVDDYQNKQQRRTQLQRTTSTVGRCMPCIGLKPMGLFANPHCEAHPGSACVAFGLNDV